MEQYEDLELEVIEFESEDVIVASDFDGEWTSGNKNP